MMRIWILVVVLLGAGHSGIGQKKRTGPNPVYVDANGVLRWTANKKEAAFFGVNYTVPFAYGYRSHRALRIDPEKAIDADVYHMARLGFDAFRVHVWDTEITDSLGNLLENEHLRLFDYLLMRLKERGIKTLITPLAFWGNGYPEKDQNTGSFSSIYNKQRVLVTEAAIKAQENYMRQFFQHVNPYTKTTYDNDPDVIAMEINNEPHHSGSKQGATAYINRMAAAVRSTGWTKPVFYNISESPTYADAVVKANVDGHSFQWYPTGLVANRTLQGNYLPHVDRYHIPFGDTIAAFRKRAKMVYEFDAGDVLASYMYPAMARSFRQAGFQWATQFAYDPLYTAYANTEYQTHFVNLAYTPSKAISLMIAGQAFHRLPREKSYGSFPADTLFDAFRVSYRNDLSEMNTPEAFYYSNTTTTQPQNRNALRQVAGVGSSPVVQYNGTGAYFLDRLEPGVWRLEVMPDALFINDPFGRAAPRRQVSRLYFQQRHMTLDLPDLMGSFTVTGINEGIKENTAAAQGSFNIMPGVYLLTKQGATATKWRLDAAVGGIKLNEYRVPPQQPDSLVVLHEPAIFASAGQALQVKAQIAGLPAQSRVSAEFRLPAGNWSNVDMQPVAGFDYIATLTAGTLTAGPLEYRILVRNGQNGVRSFPGGETGDPFAWDALPAATWKTLVLPPGAALPLFDPAADRQAISQFTTDWRTNTISFGAGSSAPFLQQVMRITKMDKTPALGWQVFVGRKIKERATDLQQFNRLQVQAKADSGSAILRVVLITKDAQSYEGAFKLDQGFEKSYELPLSSLKPSGFVLLPRPYPGFQPLSFKTAQQAPFNISDVEQLQVWLEKEGTTAPGTVQVSIQQISLR